MSTAYHTWANVKTKRDMTVKNTLVTWWRHWRNLTWVVHFSILQILWMLKYLHFLCEQFMIFSQWKCVNSDKQKLFLVMSLDLIQQTQSSAFLILICRMEIFCAFGKRFDFTKRTLIFWHTTNCLAIHLWCYDAVPQPRNVLTVCHNLLQTLFYFKFVQIFIFS
jgi:hypothetical protein